MKRIRDNRYMTEIRQSHLNDKADQLCDYSQPDDERKLEHEVVNRAIKRCMRAIISVVPDPMDSPLSVDDLLNQLWQVKNGANGLLAVYGSKQEQSDD